MTPSEREQINLALDVVDILHCLPQAAVCLTRNEFCGWKAKRILYRTHFGSAMRTWERIKVRLRQHGVPHELVQIDDQHGSVGLRLPPEALEWAEDFLDRREARRVMKKPTKKDVACPSFPWPREGPEVATVSSPGRSHVGVPARGGTFPVGESVSRLLAQMGEDW